MTYSLTLAAKDDAELAAILGVLRSVGLHRVRIGLTPLAVKAPPIVPAAEPQLKLTLVPRGDEPRQSPEPYTHIPGQTRRMAYANGTRDKGISGDELALEFVREQRIYTLEEIENEFERRLFARTSAQPTISKLVREGKLRQVAKFRYCPVGTIIHK